MKKAKFQSNFPKPSEEAWKEEKMRKGNHRETRTRQNEGLQNNVHRVYQF